MSWSAHSPPISSTIGASTLAIAWAATTATPGQRPGGPTPALFFTGHSPNGELSGRFREMLDHVDVLEQLVALRGDWAPEDFSTRLEIPEERILIIGDAHVPYHDENLLADPLCRADMLKLDAIVWLGDLLDNPTFSSW